MNEPSHGVARHGTALIDEERGGKSPDISPNYSHVHELKKTTGNNVINIYCTKTIVYFAYDASSRSVERMRHKDRQDYYLKTLVPHTKTL